VTTNRYPDVFNERRLS